MYGIYAYIDLPNHPNVGILYSIHGVSGKYIDDIDIDAKRKVLPAF